MAMLYNGAYTRDRLVTNLEYDWLAHLDIILYMICQTNTGLRTDIALPIWTEYGETDQHTNQRILIVSTPLHNKNSC
jgi:hypothetical protein